MTLRDSILHFQHQIGVVLLDDFQSLTDDVTLARRILERLDRYFFQTYDENGDIN
jgi:hypothetical protein